MSFPFLNIDESSLTLFVPTPLVDIYLRLSEDEGLPLPPIDFPSLLLNPIALSIGDDDADGTQDNDFIEGLLGDDVIRGLDGADILDGSLGTDTLIGGLGSDMLVGGEGADILDGGEGMDWSVYLTSTIGLTIDMTSPSSSTGDAAGDSFVSVEGIVASTFDDTVIGDGMNNTLIGMLGSDTLNGGAGNDILIGYGLTEETPIDQNGDGTIDNVEMLAIDVNGNDRFIGGLGDDIMIGAGGVNTYVFDKNSGQDIIVDFVIGTDVIEIVGGESAVSQLHFYQLGDDVVIESINGLIGVRNTTVLELQLADFTFINPQITAGDDVATGNEFDNNIDALSGDDVVYAEGGNDVVSGNSGNDSLFGGDGNDTLNGDDGNDELYGGDGDDVLNGGAGNDDFWGGAGADSFIGGSGYDRVMYSTSSEAVTVNLTNPAANTGDAAGDSYSGIEFIEGSRHGDTLIGDDEDNIFDGGEGDDFIDGGAGNDQLLGGLGNDRLEGGRGNDVLVGNAGNDTFVFGNFTGTDTIMDFVSGEDRIEIVGGEASFDALRLIQLGSDVVIDSINGIIVLQNVNLEDISEADFVFVDPSLTENSDRAFADDRDNTINALSGDDYVSAGGGNDTVYGQDGDDDLFGGDGDDVLFGGNGADALWGGSGADVLDGGEGRDLAVYSTASEGILVNLLATSRNTGDAAGDSYIDIEGLMGSQFADNLTGDGGDNQFFGLNGNDVLVGGRGNDRLFGGDGDDRLVGGYDNDDYFGQGGNDTIVINGMSGNDRVYDFEHGADRIQFIDSAGSMDDLTIEQVGNFVRITFAQGQIEVRSRDGSFVDAADFTADDFSFMRPADTGGNASQEDYISKSDDIFIDEYEAGDALSHMLSSSDFNSSVSNDMAYHSLVIEDFDRADRDQFDLAM